MNQDTQSTEPAQQADDILPQETPDSPAHIRVMQGCCIALMLVSAAILILSIFIQPPLPHLREYDIGGAFIYIFTVICWFFRATAINGCGLFLAIRAYRMFREAGSSISYAADYRLAKRTMLFSAALLTVTALHQIYKYYHPVL